jgi:hypothetical protein
VLHFLLGGDVARHLSRAKHRPSRFVMVPIAHLNKPIGWVIWCDVAGTLFTVDAVQVFIAAEDHPPPHVHAAHTGEAWRERFRFSYLSDVAGLYGLRTDADDDRRRGHQQPRSVPG